MDARWTAWMRRDSTPKEAVDFYKKLNLRAISKDTDHSGSGWISDKRFGDSLAVTCKTVITKGN
jgi:hypothetical protein